MPPVSVFIVEDERIIALGIQKRLTSMGYAVPGLATSGVEAVRKATELRPNLILMDIRLEGDMDGIEAAACIRGQLDLPVVFLTANSDPDTLRRAKITEPFGYVLKPYEDRDLQTAIEMALYKHEMERRLRENERWLAATLGSIGDGVIATNEVGQVRFMNGLAERLTGWPAPEAQGRPIAEVFPIISERTREPITNPAMETLQTHRSATIADGTALIRRDGSELLIDDSAAPICDATGRIAGAVLVFRDVTERRCFEEHLRQSQKMEAIGRLAGGIAHDFNNIMTVIAGFSELLLSGVSSPAEAREHLEEVKAASDRAAALSRQILTFSRRQVLLPCVLDLNTVLRDTSGMVRRLIGSHIEFLTNTDPLLGSVLADPTQITQVVMNLALNAGDAMPGGGRLAVRTADVRACTPMPGLPPGRYAVLEMTDTGCGMTDEVRAKIFEPFFTTKGRGRGTGLGLSTVYGIVKQTGGDIEVVSAVGRGTTFRVYFPVVETPGALVGSDSPACHDRGTETILVVDDDSGVRRVITMLLSQKGYSVLAVGSGPEALELLRGHAGPIQMLVTDIVMPGMSGGELAQKVVALRPGIKVLFVSGYSEDALVERGLAEATATLLSKPFSADSLSRVVRDLLDRPVDVPGESADSRSG